MHINNWSYSRDIVEFKPLCVLVDGDQASRVAQWKRAGPITQRSVDRNHALLTTFAVCSISN